MACLVHSPLIGVFASSPSSSFIMLTEDTFLPRCLVCVVLRKGIFIVLNALSSCHLKKLLISLSYLLSILPSSPSSAKCSLSTKEASIYISFLKVHHKNWHIVLLGYNKFHKKLMKLPIKFKLDKLIRKTRLRRIYWNTIIRQGRVYFCFLIFGVGESTELSFIQGVTMW